MNSGFEYSEDGEHAKDTGCLVSLGVSGNEQPRELTRHDKTCVTFSQHAAQDLSQG